jgi:hypothetical protein
MDAGQELLLSSFRSGDAPVQTLHPHWQVAIEDTSPMNLCLRRDAHIFIGGFPEAAEFVVDMEDGAYMMALFEVYSGVKWLGAPTVLYVRRRSESLSFPSPFRYLAALHLAKQSARGSICLPLAKKPICWASGWTESH